MLARSMMVRAGVVMGMPRWVVVSLWGEGAAAVDADAWSAFAAAVAGDGDVDEAGAERA